MNEHDMDANVPSSSGEEPADRRTVELLRRGGVVEQPPPRRVWASIQASLTRAEVGRGSVRLIDGSGDGGASSQATPTDRERPASSGADATRRTNPWSAGLGRLVAAAAVGALVAWAGITLVDRDQSSELLASAELVPLVEAGTEGSAEVVEVSGQQRLRVQLDGAPDAGDGYLEVWLLRPDVSGMVTLGVLEGSEGEFLLPDGIDLGEYAVVDISREHMDGDPGHGGDSLVRGEVG